MVKAVLSDKKQRELENLPYSQLIDLWEQTEKVLITEKLFDFRGILINEFERRCEKSTVKWLKSDKDSPREFFKNQLDIEKMSPEKLLNRFNETLLFPKGCQRWLRNALRFEILRRSNKWE